MAMRLSELVSLVGGTLHGSVDPPITGAAVLGEAVPGQITFIDHADKAARLRESTAAAAVVPSGVVIDSMPTIEVADVHEAFTAIVLTFRPARERVRGGISPLAQISPTARIAADVEIGPGAIVGDEVQIGAGTTLHTGAQIMAGCRIGQHCVLYPNVTLYEDTLVGDHCVLHAGVVLGGFGFGYRLVAGRHQLTAQLGHVRVEDHVEIGANSTVDRGGYGATVIGEGTKIDNQVQIGHNCRIGRHNLICAQVGIAGSTTTGDYVVMAGQVGVRDHVHIGKGSVLGAMAGVINDVPEGARMIGIPATPERDQKVKQAAFAKLPEMRKDLKALTAAVRRLEEQAAPPQRSSDATRSEAA